MMKGAARATRLAPSVWFPRWQWLQGGSRLRSWHETPRPRSDELVPVANSILASVPRQRGRRAARHELSGTAYRLHLPHETYARELLPDAGARVVKSGRPWEAASVRPGLPSLHPGCEQLPLPGREGQYRAAGVPGVPDCAHSGRIAFTIGYRGDFNALAAVAAAVAARAPRGVAQVHVQRLNFRSPVLIRRVSARRAIRVRDSAGPSAWART
jgi:hypothetical protein